MQRMDSPAAYYSCAVLTAEESNHSAAGTLYPHRSVTVLCYIALSDSLVLRKYALPVGISPPLLKMSSTGPLELPLQTP